jgi:hypothetical protein
LLPILPAAALLIGRVLAARREELSRAARVAIRLGVIVLAALVISAGVGAFLPRSVLPGFFAELPAVPALTALAVCWIVCLGAVGYAVFGRVRLRLQNSVNVMLWESAHRERGGKTSRFALATSIIAAASMIYLFLFALPAVEAYRGQREFAEQIRHAVSDPQELALYRTREIVYYLGAPNDVREFASDTELSEAVRRGEVRYAILHERDLGPLGVPCRIVVREAGQRWDREADHDRNVLVAFSPQEDGR